MSIAIDGPSGAGKSTIARAVAKKLGYIYVDTGALYRAIGLFAVRNGIATSDAATLISKLTEISLKLAYENGEQHVYLNGQDVSQDIRTPEMGMAASAVSAIPEVRAFLLDLQRDMAKKNTVIMDGRDIGTVVLPDAKVKIFLTASAEDRARRRYEEHISKGEDVSYEDILRDMKKRDHDDESRAAAPLKKADDAILVDTTGNEFEASVEIIEDIIKEHIGE